MTRKSFYQFIGCVQSLKTFPAFKKYKESHGEDTTREYMWTTNRKKAYRKYLRQANRLAKQKEKERQAKS